MTRILAIDPGTTESAWVLYDVQERRCVGADKEANEAVLRRLYDPVKTGGADFASVSRLAIEAIASYGKPVGQETFSTVLWCGRFAEAWDHYCAYRHKTIFVYRRDVKRHLCGTDHTISDPVIRQRLIDLFGPGRQQAIGKKNSPGPLYGLRADMWSALAVAVTVSQQGAMERIA